MKVVEFVLCTTVRGPIANEYLSIEMIDEAGEVFAELYLPVMWYDVIEGTDGSRQVKPHVLESAKSIVGRLNGGRRSVQFLAKSPRNGQALSTHFLMWE